MKVELDNMGVSLESMKVKEICRIFSENPRIEEEEEKRNEPAVTENDDFQ